MVGAKRKHKPVIPWMVASLVAFTAMAASILAGIDSWTSVLRGGIAFLVGYFAGSLWEAIFGKPEYEIVSIDDQNEVQAELEDRLELGPEEQAVPEEAA